MIDYIEGGEPRKSKPTGPFVLSLSPEGVPATVLEQPEPKIWEVVRELMSAKTLGNPDYHVRSSVAATLQSPDGGDVIAIEFWKGEEADHLAFISHINERVRVALLTPAA